MAPASPTTPPPPRPSAPTGPSACGAQKALGNLARTQTALDLHAQGASPGFAEETPTGSRPHARSSSTPTSTPPLDDLTTVFGPTGRLEEGQRLVLLDGVKDWCADSRTKVTIKPVIDLNAQLSTPAYELPDRICEQVILRDRTCVFPWCTRPARGCDVDHVVPHDHDAEAEGRPQPGPTQTANLAALCRFHHRLKTHTAWSYRMVEPGVLRVDQSPHGHRYRRDRHRHHADRRWVRAARSTMTTPHTLPTSSRRGQSHVRWAHHVTGHRGCLDRAPNRPMADLPS